MNFRRLDAAKGFAASVVCISHVVVNRNGSASSPLVFHFGSEAVMAFFLISGFLIHWSSHQLGQFEGARKYFAKRATRVYSVWVPAMAAIALIVYAEGRWSPDDSWARALGNLFMLQDVSLLKPAVICDPLFFNAPLWSMHYEWWFYVIYPVVLMVAEPKKRTHVVGILAVLGGITYVLIPNPLSRLFMYFSIWWIGVEAAESLRGKGAVSAPDLVRPVAYAAAAAAPIVLLCIQAWRSTGLIAAGTHPFLEARHFASAILLLSIAFAWQRLRWAGFAWTIGPFAIVTPISFSLFLVHFRSMATATYLRDVVTNPAVALAAYGTLTIAFCLLVERLFAPRLRKLLVR